MYRIVKAKFAARNPPDGERSLLERFTCLLDIANTDDSEYVWKMINDCDLDFNLAAERLLSRPPPRCLPPSVACSSSAGAAANFSDPVFSSIVQSPSSSPPKFSSPSIESPSSSPSRVSSVGLISSVSKRQCTEFPSPSTAPSSSSTIQQAEPMSQSPTAPSSSSTIRQALSHSESGLFLRLSSMDKSDPQIVHIVLQAKKMHTNLLSKIQTDGIAGLQELACLEFNMLCDTVCAKENVKGRDNVKGLVCELNKLDSFKHLQQFALSGQLWSFVPIENVAFVGACLLSQFSSDLPIERGNVYRYVKLSSFGLCVKIEYMPKATKEASMFTEILFPFSSFVLASSDDRIGMPVSVNLTFKINSKSLSDIRTDSAFGSTYPWKGHNPSSSPPLSLVSLTFYDSREAQILQAHINALKSCRSPHAIDISMISQPLQALSFKSQFNFLSDPWHLARALFDQQLLSQIRENAEYEQHIPDVTLPDSKFALRFKYPPFLMPVMMRAKERMQLTSWSRERIYIRILFDRLLKRELVNRLFPFLNSGVKNDLRVPHNFFDIPSLYISSISEEEITVVFYYNSQLSSGGAFPHFLSSHLRSVLKERTSGKVVHTFDDHLALEGQHIVSRRPLPVPNIEGAVNLANSANSTSAWMNYLALTDADVAPENHLPSFFLQSLLPSQQQSLDFMIEIEKRPCSKHLFMELDIDESLAATDIASKYREPVNHARFFSLCSINGNKFVSSVPKKTGGFLCDPMGSGKTRTCIAMIASTLAKARDLTSAGSKQACNLILVPPNVLGHWIRELESCFGVSDLEKRGFHIGPNISIAVVHGTCNSQRHNFSSNTYDIVLTTYQTFSSRSCLSYSHRQSIPLAYYRVFCDEAHVLRSKTGAGVISATFDSIWFVTGTPIVLQAEDLNPLLEHMNLKMPKETFRSLLTTNPHLFGIERQKALAILKPIFVFHSPQGIIKGVPVTCSVGSEIVTVRVNAGPREVQVYESFREILHRSRGIHAVLTKIIEGLRRSCSPRSFDPAAYLQIVSNLLDQVEIRLREEPEYVPRMVEAKFVEKNIVQALEFVSTPFAKARILELWEYLSNCEDKEPHECTVCMEVMKDPLITSCGHWFCGECVTGVLDSQLLMCPICRARTTNKNLIKLVGWQKPQLSSTCQSQTSAVAMQPVAEEGQVKVPAVLTHELDADTPSKLIYLRRKFITWVGTDDKIVIFSEFQGCLNSVVELARSVGINAAVLNHSLSLKQRSSRIADFQSSSSSLRLLAVSVATCGVGISLSAATQVIFTEPLISEALEKQCMARVCRWGQNRFCHMERLILSSSVEEILLKKRDKIKKMINLVTSVRDISDSLPALSSGVPGSVVDNEPDLAIFARDDSENPPRQRARNSGSRYNRRRYANYPLAGPARYLPMPQYFDNLMMNHYVHESDSDDSDDSSDSYPF